jgi:hypothetical protein
MECENPAAGGRVLCAGVIKISLDECVDRVN